MKPTVALAILLASSSMTAFADDHHTVPMPMPIASSLVFFAAEDGSSFASLDRDATLFAIDKSIGISIPRASGPVVFEFTNMGGTAVTKDFTHERAAVVESQLAALQPSKNDPISFISYLNYSSWGGWMYADSFAQGRGVFGGGTLTAPAAMPIKGKATYTGQTVGFKDTQPFVGTARIGADFGKQAVDLKFSDFSNKSIPTISGGGPITGNQYTAQVGGSNYGGTALGQFNGPKAQETSGVWQVTGQQHYIQGSFAARR
jgi:hypothetical protein